MYSCGSMAGGGAIRGRWSAFPGRRGLFITWLDGFVNETGAAVGYFEAPFAEQRIVNSGNQAMPLFYDNTSTDTSEAGFKLSQDWTTNGIETLAIYFQGTPGQQRPNVRHDQ